MPKQEAPNKTARTRNLDLDLERRSKRAPSKWISWFAESIDVNAHFLEFELILLGFGTGIQDAAALPRFHCFVSNQTGNTVFFAMNAFSLFGDRQTTEFQVPARSVAMSLFMFLAGVLVTGQTANYLDCKSRRWWLILSNFIGSTMTLMAGLILYLSPTADLSSPPLLAAIALLAFASGAQVAGSRQLGIPEIATTQLTAAYVDLMVDPKLFAGVCKNRSRNRRILFILALFAGSFVGAPVYRFMDAAWTIFMSCFVKWGVTLMLFSNAMSPGARERLNSLDIC